MLFAVTVVYQLSRQEQAASERRILLAARNLASTVERELSSTTRTLQALTALESLTSNDLQAFHQEATQVVQTQASWVTVILLSPEGQQLVNTLQPFGQPLPQASERDSLQEVVTTNQPAIGNFSPSILKRNLSGVPVRIPVMRDGQLQYILTAILNQTAIAQAVQAQTSIEGEWTRTIVDGQGVVVARTREPERFVGQRGTPSFLQRIEREREGVYRDTTLDNISVFIAFSQIGNSPWTAAVTVPVQVIQKPTRQALLLTVGSGLALLLVSGIGAFILSRQISRSITLAADAAAALAKGEHPHVSSLSIREVVFLGQSLKFAANLLSQREQEREENLRRAEAAREEAEAANRIKDEFLTVLSHELRTPLNPILGWSQLLRRGKLDAAMTATALETIERNAKLQTQLIEDLLDVSRILKGKLALNMAPVNLASTIEAAIATIHLAAEAKSIGVQTQFPPVALQVLGDATRLQQAIWNLLSNAVKFTPPGGQVEVQLGRVDSIAQIRVCDTGKGIHPDFVPYVFEYFRQQDSTTTRQFGGLGLGLAIVRHLVELHGGTVQAESLGEGQGATFTVSLPLFQAEQLRERTNAGEGGEDNGESLLLKDLRVLLVDDDADTRDFLSFTLAQNEAIVTGVGSAREALAAVTQASFDVLISDIGMPGMNGYQLIQAIRARGSAPNAQLKAIALTAYAGETNQEQALRAGFDRHLAKPIEPDLLVSVILDLVSAPARDRL
ncbi:MAG: response regulator [Desertifilum sp. SIO1I2]|nr:response regulator [Desertifilum sp. SIO1I2]